MPLCGSAWTYDRLDQTPRIPHQRDRSAPNSSAKPGEWAVDKWRDVFSGLTRHPFSIKMVLFRLEACEVLDDLRAMPSRTLDRSKGVLPPKIQRAIDAATPRVTSELRQVCEDRTLERHGQDTTDILEIPAVVHVSRVQYTMDSKCAFVGARWRLNKAGFPDTLNFVTDMERIPDILQNVRAEDEIEAFVCKRPRRLGVCVECHPLVSCERTCRAFDAAHRSSWTLYDVQDYVCSRQRHCAAAHVEHSRLRGNSVKHISRITKHNDRPELK